MASDKPIAVCEANEVEAWEYPFWVKPAEGLEPTFLYLEDHLYNLDQADKELLDHLVRVDSPEDLERLGYRADEEGVYRL